MIEQCNRLTDRETVFYQLKFPEKSIAFLSWSWGDNGDGVIMVMG